MRDTTDTKTQYVDDRVAYDRMTDNSGSKGKTLCLRTLHFSVSHSVLAFLMILFMISAACMYGNKVQAAVSDAPGFPLKALRIGYIYTGDSRMRRLNLTVRMRKMTDTWVVCKSGMGYSWFKLAGLPKIKQIMKAHSEIEKWVIISGWGVNDLWNGNSYINTYRSLMKGDWKGSSLYLMSVNPVNGSKRYNYVSIPSFNSALKQYVESSVKSRDYYSSNPKLSYIDTNSYMTKHGFSTIDGLHYTENTNRLIYEKVRRVLDDNYTRINYTGLQLNQKSERTLRLLDDNYYPVRWKSSDKKVVKITKTFGEYSQNAVIKAVSCGTATITAKSRGRTYECIINVINDNVLVVYYYQSDALKAAAVYLQKRVGGKLYEIGSDRKCPLPTAIPAGTAATSGTTDNSSSASSTSETSDNVIASSENTQTHDAALSSPATGPAVSVDRSDAENRSEETAPVYQKIYIVFPIRDRSMPDTVNEFIKHSDLGGKDIYPIGTSEEIDKPAREKQLSKVVKKIKKKIPADSFVHAGLVLNEEKADSDKAKKKIRKWTASPSD